MGIKPGEALKEIVRRRVGTVYRDGLLMLLITSAANLALIYAKLGAVPPAVLGALAAGQEPGSGLRLAVLLDDEPLVHRNWKLAARAAGTELKAYKDPADFSTALETVPKDTPIFIDSELGSGVKGEDLAAGLREK